MKLLLITILLVASAWGANLDIERALDATRAVENWEGRDGKGGELGPYGIKRVVWQQHMGKLDFALARQESYGRECAKRHILWLARQLKARGVAQDMLMIALAYNAGLDRVLRGKAGDFSWGHARRVNNVYQSLLANTPVRHGGAKPRSCL